MTATQHEPLVEFPPWFDDRCAGRPFFTEPNMIVVPEVTLDAIQKAVATLWHEGAFRHLKSA
jgi:hypothetical protein